MVFKHEQLKQYIDFTYHVKYDEPREQLHEQIIDSYFLNKKPTTDPKLIFTAGCYGAGKSNVMKYLESNGKINLTDYVYVDQDKIRPLIPEYENYLSENPMSAGFKTNKETGYLSELIQLYALENNYNLIVDGSLRDHEWYSIYINLIKTQYCLYTIIILFVSASYANILIRNSKRAKLTKRTIPKDCIKDAYIQSPIAFDILKKLVHKHYEINNDTETDKEFTTKDIII